MPTEQVRRLETRPETTEQPRSGSLPLFCPRSTPYEDGERLFQVERGSAPRLAVPGGERDGGVQAPLRPPWCKDRHLGLHSKDRDGSPEEVTPVTEVGIDIGRPKNDLCSLPELCGPTVASPALGESTVFSKGSLLAAADPAMCHLTRAAEKGLIDLHPQPDGEQRCPGREAGLAGSWPRVRFPRSCDG